MSVSKNIAFYPLLLIIPAIGAACLITADRIGQKQIREMGAQKVVYRIMVEGGLEERQSSTSYTTQEQQAVNDLKAVLANWPQRMWLTSVEGRLMLFKMGVDGKPVGK